MSYRREDVDRHRPSSRSSFSSSSLHPRSNYEGRSGYHNSRSDRNNKDRRERSPLGQRNPSFDRSSKISRQVSSSDLNPYESPARNSNRLKRGSSHDKYLSDTYSRGNSHSNSNAESRDGWNKRQIFADADLGRSSHSISHRHRNDSYHSSNESCEQKFKSVSHEIQRNHHNSQRMTRSSNSEFHGGHQDYGQPGETKNRYSPYELPIKEVNSSYHHNMQPVFENQRNNLPNQFGSSSYHSGGPFHSQWRGGRGRGGHKPKVLLPTPKEPQAALFAELVVTGAAIALENNLFKKLFEPNSCSNSQSTALANFNQPTKKTLLPTPVAGSQSYPLPVEDLRNRLVCRMKKDFSFDDSNAGPSNEFVDPNNGGTQDDYGEGTHAAMPLNGSEEPPHLLPIKSELPQRCNYDGISKQFLFCHLCVQHLQDGAAFENHLKEPMHLSLVQSFQLNYEMQANLLRHNAQLEEKRRSVEVECVREGESVKFCSQCQVKVEGCAAAHRKSTQHQKLERFLNPVCRVCHQEFASRMERDEHWLTADHLRALQSLEKSVAPENGHAESDAAAAARSAERSQSPFLFADDEAVGQVTIQRVSAYHCRICHNYFTSRSEAYEVHCKSKQHAERYFASLNPSSDAN